MLRLSLIDKEFHRIDVEPNHGFHDVRIVMPRVEKALKQMTVTHAKDLALITKMVKPFMKEALEIADGQAEASEFGIQAVMGLVLQLLSSECVRNAEDRGLCDSSSPYRLSRISDPDISQEAAILKREYTTPAEKSGRRRQRQSKKDRFKGLSLHFQRLLANTDLTEARRRVLNCIWRDVHKGVNAGDMWHTYLKFLGQSLQPDFGLGAREHPCVFLELKRFDIGLEAHSKSQNKVLVCMQPHQQLTSCFFLSTAQRSS
jgi:hypothetical protein